MIVGLIGVVGVFIATLALGARSQQDIIKIAVARRDIAAGALLSSDDVAIIDMQIDPSYPRDLYLITENELPYFFDGVVTQNIREGALLHKGDVIPPGSDITQTTSIRLLYQIPPSKTMVYFPVAPNELPLSLARGDYVSVLFLYSREPFPDQPPPTPTPNPQSLGLATPIPTATPATQLGRSTATPTPTPVVFVPAVMPVQRYVRVIDIVYAYRDNPNFGSDDTRRQIPDSIRGIYLAVDYDLLSLLTAAKEINGVRFAVPNQSEVIVYTPVPGVPFDGSNYAELYRFSQEQIFGQGTPYYGFLYPGFTPAPTHTPEFVPISEVPEIAEESSTATPPPSTPSP